MLSVNEPNGPTHQQPEIGLSLRANVQQRSKNAYICYSAFTFQAHSLPAAPLFTPSVLPSPLSALLSDSAAAPCWCNVARQPPSALMPADVDVDDVWLHWLISNDSIDSKRAALALTLALWPRRSKKIKLRPVGIEPTPPTVSRT